MIQHIWFGNITSEDVTAIIRQDIKDIQKFYKRIVKVKTVRFEVSVKQQYRIIGIRLIIKTPISRI